MKTIIINALKQCFYKNRYKYLDVFDIKDYLEKNNNIKICNNTIHNYIRFLIDIGFNISIVNDRHNKYYFILENDIVNFLKE
ncbi:TPA: hypothetical protein I9Z34_003061 [Clostridium perfringens]|nr:hypothetical protein [Clostridium perfringens]